MGGGKLTAVGSMRVVLVCILSSGLRTELEQCPETGSFVFLTNGRSFGSNTRLVQLTRDWCKASGPGFRLSFSSCVWRVFQRAGSAVLEKGTPIRRRLARHFACIFSRRTRFAHWQQALLCSVDLSSPVQYFLGFGPRPVRVFRCPQ